jgi:hypothetical protein
MPIGHPSLPEPWRTSPSPSERSHDDVTVSQHGSEDVSQWIQWFVWICSGQLDNAIAVQERYEDGLESGAVRVSGR